MTRAINLWSSPRNISTALMYSFAQRPDTSVTDEPLYAHFLLQEATSVAHPGREDILATQCHSAEEVVSRVLLKNYATPYVVHKQMTHHLINLDWSFMTKCKNVLLIRNPRHIIASYAKVIPDPGIEDVGIAKQIELKAWLEQRQALHAIVDARELLLDPEGVLRQLCSRLDMPFDPLMLSWPAGPRPEDGVWAGYWYAGVHRSIGFKAYQEKNIALPSDLEALANTCMPYYERLFEESIKSDKF